MLYLYHIPSQSYVYSIPTLDDLDYTMHLYHYYIGTNPNDQIGWTGNDELPNPFHTEYYLVDSHRRILSYADIKRGVVDPFPANWTPAPRKQKPYSQRRNGKTYSYVGRGWSWKQERARAKEDQEWTGKNYRTAKLKAKQPDWDHEKRSHKGRCWKQQKIRKQWQKHEKKASTQRPIDKRDPLQELPYPGLYRYIGTTNADYTHGKEYRVIETAVDFVFRQWCAFVTINDFPDTTDPDYSCAFKIPDFNRHFEKLTV